MTTRTKIILILVALGLVLAGLGTYLYFTLRGPLIESTAVERGSLTLTVKGPGKVSALAKTDVYPKVQSIVDEIYVEDGSQVTTGTILLRLNEEALKLNVRQAEVAVAQAKAAKDLARYQQDAQKSTVQAARSGVASAKDGLNAAKESEISTKEALDNAQAHLDSLDPAANPAEYAAAQTALSYAQTAYSVSRASVASAESVLAQAKAALEQAEKSPTSSSTNAAQSGLLAAEEGLRLAQEALDNAVIAAPASGKVVFAPTTGAMMSAQAGAAAAAAGALGSGSNGAGAGESLEKGSAVTPGSPILSIVDESRLGFSAEIDETSIPSVKIGQSAKLSLTSYEGKEINGEVFSISQAAKQTITGGNIFKVDLSIDEKELQELELRLGMKGDIVITVDTTKSGLIVPTTAFFSEGGNDFVYVVKENKLKKTSVVKGSETATQIEILDGVKQGDVVAIATNVGFKDGLRVRFKK